MKNEVLIYILKYCSIASGLVPLLCCFGRFRYLQSFLKVLFVYSAICIVTEGISIILAWYNKTTYLVHNCFTILECSMFFYLYWNKLSGPNSKKIIQVLFALFLIIAFIVFVLDGRFNKGDDIASTFSAVLLVILAASYFYNAANDESHERMTDDYFFWISTAVMLYFCMAFIFFLFADYIEKRGIKTVYYSLQWVVNILYNILLGVGIWKVKQK